MPEVKGPLLLFQHVSVPRFIKSVTPGETVRQEDVNEDIYGLSKIHILMPGTNMCFSVTVNRRVAVVDVNQ